MPNILHHPGLEGRHIEESALILYERYLPLHEEKPLNSFVTQEDNQRLIAEAEGREIEGQVEGGRQYQDDYLKQYRPDLMEARPDHTDDSPNEPAAGPDMSSIDSDAAAPAPDLTSTGPDPTLNTPDANPTVPGTNPTVQVTAQSSQDVADNSTDMVDSGPGSQASTSLRVQLPRTLARRASLFFSSLLRISVSNADSDSEIEFEMCE